MTVEFPQSFEPDRVAGEEERSGGDTPVTGATWYRAGTTEDALVYYLPDGALADAAFLTFDALVDGEHSVSFQLRLHDDGTDRTFRLHYSLLPECEARIRMPLGATEQDRWKYDREGAWCKPFVAGDRVEPAAVDRIELAVPTGPLPVRWCQTPVEARGEEPPRLTDPTLPEGPLLDEFGQSTLHDWDGYTGCEGELVERLRDQRRLANDDGPIGPEDGATGGGDSVARDEWGGWTGREFEATGFFRVERDDDRWWLVTPDGHPFWSTGLDCVRPNVHTRYDGLEAALSWLPDADGEFAAAREDREEWSPGAFVNYGVANLIRAFGPDEWKDAWGEIALNQLRHLGFNTVGNWSDRELASDAGVPYVRAVELAFPEELLVFRDFPDVFHEGFPDAADDVATPLEDTADDPSMVGYFLGNEPRWNFAGEPPAVGMLYETEQCSTRRELADWLAERHGGESGLADAWEADVTLDDVRSGRWDRPLTGTARRDLEAFSGVMVERLYEHLDDACRSVDPNHLNLGSRFPGLPAEWALEGLSTVDVFSVNCYWRWVPDEYADAVEAVDAPVLVGEWHFGALDVGLPAAGIQRVPDQAARADAYRVYLERTAATPWCVGAHYFTMYDQSALGRFDGEAFNVGFFDVCHRPYEPLADAARRSHERLYDLAAGDTEPCDDEPEYLTEF